MTPPTADRDERGIRPTVALRKAGLSTGAIAIGAVALGLLLFGVLDARRRAATAPAVAARGFANGPSEAPPALYVPPALPSTTPPERLLQSPASSEPVQTVTRIAAAPLPAAIQVLPQSVQAPPLAPERPARAAGASALVLDTSQPRSAPVSEAAGAASALSDGVASAVRARAGSIANRTTTVPQGTLIPAVLETAFNSSRAGFARALVQRNVYGFDGKRVLIPRGSRLIGEYRSDATPGQKRALVNWTRLIRPDGATIAIGSPATDPLGTGGIRAKVDSHFLERFSGAILQSALDVGVNLASRSSNSPVVVALPGAVQNTTSGTGTALSPVNIPPTLSIQQGTSISVFVARDLDFTEVENGR